MSCKVRVPSMPDLRLNEHSYATLRVYAQEMQNGQGSVSIPIRDLANMFNVRVSTIQRANNRLSEQGLIQIERQFYEESGGQRENSVIVTEKGWAVLGRLLTTNSSPATSPQFAVA